LVVGLGPQVDNLVVLLASGNQTGGVLVLDFLHFGGSAFNDVRLLVGEAQVVHTDGSSGNGRVGKAGVHQLVSEDHRLFQTHDPVAGVDQLGDRLLLQRLVNQLEGQALGQNLEQQRATDSGVDDAGFGGPALVLVLDGLFQTHLDQRVQLDMATAVGHFDFGNTGEAHAFAAGVDPRTGHVIQTQYHVLRRHDNRLTAGGGQDVVGGHHQRTRFQLGFQRQRYVHGHLVTVKVGVVGSTDQRMQLDGLTFNQDRLERLDTQTVQRRCTVQQDRVLADDLGEDVPHFRQLALDHLLGGLDGGRQTTVLQLAEDEWLEQLQRHLLGQTALVQAQGRTDHDHRTTGVVDALTQQVLTETTLLTLDHIGQGFQRALVGASDGTAATAVVQQRINRFLQHALFVAHDDVRRRQVEQALEAVVTVDHPAIQIVQVGGRETATVQRYQRTQVRRQHGQYGHDHPFRLVAGALEGFHQLQTLGQLLDLG